jgi:hypothetical protein
MSKIVTDYCLRMGLDSKLFSRFIIENEIKTAPFPVIPIGTSKSQRVGAFRSEIWARSSAKDARYLLGRKFDFVNYDECARDPHGDKILDEVLRMRLADRSGRIDMTSTAAEKLKIAQGLLRTKNNEQLLYALAPLVSVLKDEINKLRNYWSGPAGAQRPPLERLILSGGQATLPGLSEYFAAGVGLPAELADVWTNLLNPRQQKPPLDFNQSQKYATAIGLGLRPYLSHHD